MDKLSKVKILIGFIILFFIIGLVSCSKKPDNTSQDESNTENMEAVEVKSDDVAETDEDLLTVDYKEFYDELAPEGEWIEVTDKEIGIDLKNGTASGESEHRTVSFSDLFGVKEANANVDAGFGAFFVWKPSPNLAVGISTETEPVQQPVYVPYSNGQWLHTDAGWYFQAATPVEEITHHHGRWVHSPSEGWLWVPGRVWAPAWVDWREEGDYVAWTPIPPSFYIVNNVVVAPPVYEERYIVVERRYFAEPYVYKHSHWGHKHKIKEWRRLDGIMVVNNQVICRGPDVQVIQTSWGRNIDIVKIDRVKSYKEIGYSGGKIHTFSPEFKKVKVKNKNIKSPVFKPEKFSNYKDRVSKNDKDGRSVDGTFDNKGKLDNNKSGSDNKFDRKLSNDNDMKNGKNKDDNNKIDRNKRNDNKGNDNKGKDKIEKKKQNDNSKGKDNNNKGNDRREKGNDKKGKDDVKKDNSSKDNNSKDNNKDNSKRKGRK